MSQPVHLIVILSRMARQQLNDLIISIGVRANIHLGGQTEFCPNGARKLFEADQIRWGGGGVVAEIFRDLQKPTRFGGGGGGSSRIFFGGGATDPPSRTPMIIRGVWVLSLSKVNAI